MVNSVKLAALGVLAVLTAAPASAQQPKPITAAAPASSPAPRAALVPLTVRIVISRSQEGKPPTSRPYELSVPANDNSGASLADGVQVLIPMVTVGDKTTGPVYKDVGTVIKCSAASLDAGRFRLNVELEDASVLPDTKLPADGVRGPWIQTFRAEQILILKDGQTTEFASGIDRSTGELVKVAVTLTVAK